MESGVEGKIATYKPQKYLYVANYMDEYIIRRMIAVFGH